MSAAPHIAKLDSRALIAVGGEDWRDWLQGLITQDVETLGVGELRFGALLSPQGRLLFDLFVLGREDGAWLDVPSASREALLGRLKIYRLRAKVTLELDETPVLACFETPSSTAPQHDELNKPRHGEEGRDADRLDPKGGESQPRTAWPPDPRLPALGWRGYGEAAANAEEAAYDAHRLILGVPAAADYGADATYPIEANFDLLNGIAFKKGCFVGQETTSRMKRRGQIKSRMAPIVFDGPPPPIGAEILNGERRAGEVLSGMEGRAMALLRLDRADGDLTVDGRPVHVDWPKWLER